MDTIEWYNELRSNKIKRKLEEEEVRKNYKPTFECCGDIIEGGHNKQCVNYDPLNQPIRKNRIISHTHDYFLSDNQMVGFDTTEELLEIDFVKGMSEIKDFYRYSVSGNHLMAEYKNGKEWWVIGTIRNAVNLPKLHDI